MIKLFVIAVLRLGVYLGCCLSILVTSTSYALTNDSAELAHAKTNLHAKFYQQALYHYFQSDYSTALNIIGVGKTRLGKLEQTSQLFEAGLQVNLGLNEQAKQTLLSFDKINLATKIKSNELLVLALFALTEQLLAQNELLQAQQTLAKIPNAAVSGITVRNYQQYHLLSQLAYWPNKPIVQPILIVNDRPNKQVIDLPVHNVAGKSPYIQLNKALRLIEVNDDSAAIPILTELKRSHWQAPKQNFWHTLFSQDNELAPAASIDERIQKQAINDYSRLLLAQVYVKQQAYNKAFVELETFPQHSPYAEPALFLFAFSAQKTKKNAIALKLLTLFYQRYPFSNLGWQAGLLMGEQTTVQHGLSKGLQVYQVLEHFFVQHMNTLKQLEASYLPSVDLLAYATAERSQHDALATPELVWLQQAVADASVNSLYQQLIELTILQQKIDAVQHKRHWVAQTIQLNTKRKQRIARSQISDNNQEVYQQLIEKRRVIADKLTIALSDPQQSGVAFANQEEQLLLERMKRSNQLVTAIASQNSDNELNKVEQYQQRLARVTGVLAWQLNRQYPQRAWQHQQQMEALNSTLADLEILQNKVHFLVKSVSVGESELALLDFSQQLAMLENKIAPLSKQLNQLKAQVTLKTRQKISDYIQTQQNLLRQHLLATRKAMAAILERILKNDKQKAEQHNVDEQDNAINLGVRYHKKQEQLV